MFLFVVGSAHFSVWGPAKRPASMCLWLPRHGLSHTIATSTQAPVFQPRAVPKHALPAATAAAAGPIGIPQERLRSIFFFPSWDLVFGVNTYICRFSLRGFRGESIAGWKCVYVFQGASANGRKRETKKENRGASLLDPVSSRLHAWSRTLNTYRVSWLRA